jgi:hypothetical protein
MLRGSVCINKIKYCLFFVALALPLSGNAQRNNPHGNWKDQQVTLPIAANSPICSNANVTSFAESTSLIYLAGNFTELGECTGSFLPVDPNDGRVLIPKSQQERIRGDLRRVISDGNGGWYFAGAFFLQGVSYHLAHLDANFNVQVAFLANFDNIVNDIYFDGLNLFAVGEFSTVSGSPRVGFASLNPLTGALNTVNVGLNGIGHRIVPAGTDLIVGGSFSSVGMSLGSGLALDISTGAVLFTIPLANGAIEAVETDPTGNWYLGGSFTSIGGISLPGLAKLNTNGTIDLSFIPSIEFPVLETPTLRSLKYVDGHLYLSGNFMKVSDQWRKGVAIMNATTASVVSSEFYPASRPFAAEKVGDKIYVGGEFSTVGRTYGGYLAAVDISTGLLDSNFPKANGPISAIVDDGNGGWFVAGRFNQIGGVAINGLAHIQSTKIVNSSFNPLTSCSLADCPSIFAMSLDGTSLYVTGSFSTLNGSPRTNIGAFDTTDLSLKSFAPVLPNGTSRMVAKNNYVYLDCFGTFNGSPCAEIVKVDSNGNRVTGWKIELRDSNFNGYMTPNAIAIDDDKIYVGGTFDRVNGSARTGLAAVTISDASLSSWAPSLSEREVISLSIDGSQIYIGGYFASINGTTRYSAASVDTTTGSVSAWFPNMRDCPGVPGYYSTLHASSAGVFASGDFMTIGGENRYRLALLNKTDGTALAWDPKVDLSPSIILQTGNLVVLGSQQAMAFDTDYRNGLAAIEISGYQRDSWNPNGSEWNSRCEDNNNSVRFIIHDSNKLYLGGHFTNIFGNTRNHLAAIGVSGGVESWSPSADWTVLGATKSDANLILQGWFSQINGSSRHRIASVSLGTGATQAFQVDLGPTASPYQVYSTGEKLFVSGWGLEPSGEVRNGLAIFESSTGNLDPLTIHFLYGGPNAYTRFDNKILIASGANQWSTTSRRNLVQFDKSTASPVSHTPLVNGVVRELHTNGDKLYLAGDFSSVGGQSRNFLAQLDWTSGTISNWNPNPDASVSKIQTLSGYLYAVGSFSIMAGQSRTSFARFDSSGSLDPLSIAFNGPVTAVERLGSDLFFAGNFSTIDSQNRSGSAIYSMTTEEPKPWVMRWGINNSFIKDIIVENGIAYFFGSIQYLNPQPRNKIAALDNSYRLTDFNPNPDGDVYVIEYIGDSLWVGGNFNNIGGQPSGYLAKLNAKTGTTVSWANGIDGSVSAIQSDGTRLFVKGGFTEILGSPRNGFASINPITLSLNPWSVTTANQNNDIHSFIAKGGKVYLAGWFTDISGTSKSYLAAVDAVTGALDPWSPNPDAQVEVMAHYGSRLYFAGAFNSIASENRSKIAAFDISDGTESIDTSWNPGASGGCCVMYMSANADTVYVSGDFGSMGGANMCATGAIDATTGLATSFERTCYFSPMKATNNRVYFGASETRNGIFRSFGILNKTTGQFLNQ